jgi:PHD/YefM family antitoxin component YafN of YafNO toxin-antitoxin module
MLTTVSARQIQREYKKILEDANRLKEPIIVISNNKPQGAIIGLELLEKVQLDSLLKQALKDSSNHKTKAISTKGELDQDLQELEEYV